MAVVCVFCVCACVFVCVVCELCCVMCYVVVFSLCLWLCAFECLCVWWCLVCVSLFLFNDCGCLEREVSLFCSFVFICVLYVPVLRAFDFKLCVLCVDVLCDVVWFEYACCCVCLRACVFFLKKKNVFVRGVSTVLCDVVWCVGCVFFVCVCLFKCACACRL